MFFEVMLFFFLSISSWIELMQSITSMKTLLLLFMASIIGLKTNDRFTLRFPRVVVVSTNGCLMPLTIVVKSKSSRLMIIRWCGKIDMNDCEKSWKLISLSIRFSVKFHTLSWIECWIRTLTRLLKFSWFPLEQNHFCTIFPLANKGKEIFFLWIFSWLLVYSITMSLQVYHMWWNMGILLSLETSIALL